MGLLPSKELVLLLCERSLLDGVASWWEDGMFEDPSALKNVSILMLKG